MKQYLLVLKLLIKNNYFPKRQKGEKRDSTKIMVLASLGIVYIIFAPILVATVFFMAQTAKNLGIQAEFVTVLLGIASIMVLLLGIFSILSYLYFSKDTEFFLSLPIKPSAIFFAKFTIIYVREAVLSIAILVPTLITVGLVTNAPWLFYVLMPIGILLVPALPLMLASLISIPLMYVVSFFKNKGAWTSVIVLLLGGAAFAVYFYFIQTFSSGDFENIGEEQMEALAPVFTMLATILYPYLAFSRAAFFMPFGELSASISTLINLGIFIATIASLFVLTMLITNLVYKRSAASQLENRKSQTKSNDKFSASSARTALIKKEWREIIRQPAFAFNVLAPIIITPIMMLIMGFTANFGFGGTYENGENGGNLGMFEYLMPQITWFGLFLMLLIFSVSMNTGAMTTITREGKSFHISKLIPASYKTQIQAKVFISMSISFVASLAGLIVISILELDFINLAFGILVCMVLGYAFTCYATYNDLKKPKLDWVTPNQATKQNFGTIVPMLIGMLFSIVFFGIALLAIFVLPEIWIAQIVAWPIMLGFAVALAVLMHRLLYNNVDRLYERLGES